jgi:hypothetical protein
VDRTAEVRWFFRGSPPAAVAAWFDAAAAQPPQIRSDAYLVLTGTDALGVKVRGGTANLEFKLRPRPPEPLPLPLPVDAGGQLEQWQRWSFARPALSRLVPRLGLPKARWRTVRKERRLVTLPYGGRSDAGCRVELTALEVDGSRWSTVGFESYGPDDDLVPALRSAAERFFGSLAADLPGLPGGLGAERSCGYPGWLATL